MLQVYDTLGGSVVDGVLCVVWIDAVADLL